MTTLNRICFTSASSLTSYVILFPWMMLAQAQIHDVPKFEVLSIKSSGTTEDHTRIVGSDHFYTAPPVELHGNRLSGDCGMLSILGFAFSPLQPDGREINPTIAFPHYRIEGITPDGTTLEVARVMLRNALVERLGLRYRIENRKVKVSYLVRGAGPLKVQKSTGAEPPGPVWHETWTFKTRKASIDSFARFLSSLAGHEVIDKTGIRGDYEFNIDWHSELQGAQGSEAGVGLARTEAKRLGLDLSNGSEDRPHLVIQGAKALPTPN